MLPLQIEDGKILWSTDGSPLTTAAADEMIFVVAAKDGQMYCHRKETKANPR